MVQNRNHTCKETFKLDMCPDWVTELNVWQPCHTRHTENIDNNKEPYKSFFYLASLSLHDIVSNRSP